LPAANPSALITSGKPRSPRAIAASASARRGTVRELRSGHVVARHEVLREHLAPLERGGRARRADDGAAAAAKRVGDAGAEGHFGPHDGEVYLFLFRDLQQIGGLASDPPGGTSPAPRFQDFRGRQTTDNPPHPPRSGAHVRDDSRGRRPPITRMRMTTTDKRLSELQVTRTNSTMTMQARNGRPDAAMREAAGVMLRKG
jgi:hypothetical protein